MNEDPTIFPENEITPEYEKAQRKIVVARALLILLLILTTSAIIIKGKISDTNNLTLIITYFILLIFSYFRPLAGFALAALVTSGEIIYIIYLTVTLWLEYDRFLKPQRTITFITLMLIVTASFIIAAGAARKLKRLRKP